ncbi:sugar phosphate isomerase/epimerase family protein [Streptomyces sulphureus]|uniref:sugar phosphate isomerase/epimerase family protein n=1 Tax=Streptomyces sulphureus TaxID=47758 RepID=UPI000376A8C4|nr:sugar phosphate isomerase/epimerase [Streptomyces sulphureus]
MTRRTRNENPALDHRLRRRNFLGVAVGAAAAAALAGNGAAQAAPAGRGHRPKGPLVPEGRLGIQLYTLRDQIEETGFGPVFEALAEYGYDTVEFAGYTHGTGEITLPELKALTEANGLRGIGSHVGYYSDDPDGYTFAGQLDQVMEDAAELGLPYIGTASGPDRYGNTVEGWKRVAEEFNTYGAAARDLGMKFYQHNHQMEFAFAEDDPETRLYDVLLAETDPELVYLEMDIFWAYCGQYRFSTRPDGTPAPFEPLDYVLAQPDRYPLFHVKDGEHDGDSADGYQMVDVGDGVIDYVSFLRAAVEDGAESGHEYLVERDDAGDPELNPPGSLHSAEQSAAYLLKDHRPGRPGRPGHGHGHGHG